MIAYLHLDGKAQAFASFATLRARQIVCFWSPPRLGHEWVGGVTWGGPGTSWQVEPTCKNCGKEYVSTGNMGFGQ